MLKVVVFDSGWGGELFADYLERELPILEVIREIDWRHAPYEGRSSEELCRLTEGAIKKYIGRVELIVLAGQAVSVLAIEYLRKKFPEQKIIGFGLRLEETLEKIKEQRVIYLATSNILNSEEYKKAKLRFKNREFLEPDCTGWSKLIDDGELTEEKVVDKLSNLINDGVQVIVLGCTTFVDFKEKLEERFGWRVRVVDDFGLMVKDVCKVLRIRGGDGRRRK